MVLGSSPSRVTMYTTYVIKNDNEEIYIGQTDNLEKRLKRHNGELSTKKDSYTSIRKKGEWKLVYQELFETRFEARKREKELKSYRGREFIRKIKVAQLVDPPAGGLLS